jgi:hypothetical protein
MEQRQTGRQRVIGQADIIARDEQQSITCSVFNLSQGGAMLGVPVHYKCPESFILQMKDTRKSVPARLAWNQEGLVGVKFLGSLGD